MTLRRLFGIDVPIVQAPMAGVQGSALAIAASDAGGLGSLPCAMLTPEGIRDEVAAIRAQTSRPFNIHFFCHTPPPFGVEAAAVLDAARPAVVSFHFGLPPLGDDDARASRRARKRRRAPHGAHQRLHRPAGARHRRSHRARARSAQRVRTGVSIGDRSARAAARGGRAAGLGGFLPALVGAESERLPRASRRRADARTRRRVTPGHFIGRCPPRMPRRSPRRPGRRRVGAACHLRGRARRGRCGSCAPRGPHTAPARAHDR